MHLKKIILFLLYFIVFTRVADAAMPPSFHTGRITFSADSEYFWTKSNYDENGVSKNLIGQNTYDNFTTDFSATYFITGGWAIAGGAGYAYASSKSIEDRTNGGFTSLFFSTKKLISISQLRFIPVVDLSVTLQKIAPETDEVLIHDGVNSVQAGSWAAYDFWKMRAYGYAGFEYRDDNRSALLPWVGGLGLKTSKWFFSAELNGYQSITDDEYTDNHVPRTIVTNKVNGGSMRYYSVNPNLIEARAQVGFNFAQNYNLSFGYAQTLTGENTAEGQSVFAGLAYNLNTSVTDTQINVKKRRLEKFEPLIEEDYDESLFEEDL